MYTNRNKKDSFDTVSLKIASPEKILGWSEGEVTKPETINYRTQRPEKNGLFDERIFGPDKDFECYCGKYRGIRFKGITCEKCGVEITRSIVRRERMGHIDLAVPVSHIWFLRGIPSRIATLLGMSTADADKVIYFAGYIITDVHEEDRERLLKELDKEFKTKLATLTDDEAKEVLKERATEAKNQIKSIQKNTVLDESTYHRFALKYGAMFEARIGAEALYDILKNINLEKFISKLTEKLETATSVKRVKLEKRIALAKNMLRSGGRPEWMFLTRLAVIPPALRPMVALEGGRHASSDINDLYRRVINRNNRLKKLIAIQAPDVILRNEKRILQEAVDALMDNSIRRGNTAFSAAGQASRRPLKSLSDFLKGKQGYFRQNLLGKRVDYSGRSVIVIGPDLALDQCGLPKHMALELFRPFIIHGLLEREIAFNIRGAGRLIEEGIPEVWAILEEVIKDKYVMLNRAPTLHRQSIQAFRPVLIEGNAIQIHALVCPAFNADFDGDTMSVHVPISDEAQTEAREIMNAKKNILKPGSGDVTTTARHDIILGCYWMTKMVKGGKGEGRAFESTNAAIGSYDYGVVDFRSNVRVLPSENKKYAEYEGKLFETTVGRLLFNSVLPNDFPYINEEITNKRMASLVDELIAIYGLEGLPDILDKITAFGFKYATHSGITFGLSDLETPEEKDDIIADGHKAADEVIAQYNEGLLSEDERHKKVIEIWHKAKMDVEKVMPDVLDKDGSVFDMIESGARGSVGQLTQMAGMKGLISNTKGETIEFPITASYKEGMSPTQYFVTTHGSRKGLADTALKTAQAGYLTRRLFDVSQDVVITMEDCGTSKSTVLKRFNSIGMETPLARNAKGRIVGKTIKDTDENIVFSKGHLLSGEDAAKLEELNIEEVIVRSPMTCEAEHGLCQKCYGTDMSTAQLVELGEAIGTVAAQSLGEPSTQLTMNTKHKAGAASIGGDIAQGLPRVEEVLEGRNPKNPAVIAKIDGIVSEIIDDEAGFKKILLTPSADTKRILKRETEYKVPLLRTLNVKPGDEVKKGRFMTDGSAALKDILEYTGANAVREYIISEVLKIYDLQGIAVSRKHLEVVVKQMFARVEITDSGDTRFSVGEVIEVNDFNKANKDIKTDGGQIASAKQLVLGITAVSLSRSSWLSSASFQHVTRKLIDAAVRGTVDKLKGLKENVIVGRLVPAGTGFKGSNKQKMIASIDEAQTVDSASDSDE